MPRNSMTKKRRLIVKKCHMCMAVNESEREIERCKRCGKSFLPLNYFGKVHDSTSQYASLFAEVDELHDDDLIKGIYVIW